MEILSLLLAVSGWAAVPAAGGLWLFQRWRSRRRNENGGCAVCGDPWSGRAEGERFLIHGRLVCGSCASRTRSRLGWQLGLLGGAGLFSTVIVFLGGDPAIMALLPPALVAGFTVGAVVLMKRANRRAESQIVSGSFPFLPADEGWRPEDPDDA